MTVETVWLRAAYAVPGRLPRCQVTWHAVSEAVPVEVPTLSEAEAPVSLRVIREGTPRDVADAESIAYLARVARPATVTQSFEVRRGPDGPLCPVFGPDGRTHVAAADLPRLTAEVAAMHAMGATWMGGSPAWASYPGTIPSALVRGKRKPDPARPGSPERPVWASPNLSEARLTNLGEDVRAAEMSAFLERTNGLAIIDGRLWTPCGAPVAARRHHQETSDLVLPLRDGDVTLDVEMPCYVAVANLGDEAALGEGVAPTWNVEAVAPLGARHDADRTNLLLLPPLLDVALSDAAWRGVHEEVRPLLGLVAGLRRVLVRPGTDVATAKRVIVAEAARALAVLGPVADQQTRSMGAFLVALDRWSKVARNLNAMAAVPAPREEEPAFDGLTF